MRSAVSYFYRFAERHIDGETSAVSSAADVQATSPSYPPMCSLMITSCLLAGDARRAATPYVP